MAAADDLDVVCCLARNAAGSEVLGAACFASVGEALAGPEFDGLIDDTSLAAVKPATLSSTFANGNSRLTRIHDAAMGPEIHADGTLFAARRVMAIAELVQGLDRLLRGGADLVECPPRLSTRCRQGTRADAVRGAAGAGGHAPAAGPAIA